MRRLIGNSNLKATAILILGSPSYVHPRTAQTNVRHKRQVVVSLEDRKLVLLEDGQVKKIYPVAVGRPTHAESDGQRFRSSSAYRTRLTTTAEK